jgi:phage baseplate assembly protein W
MKPSPPAQIGWPLLPSIEDGQMRYPSLGESVRDNLKVILLTRPGEQLMHPDFGAGLEDFLHEPNTLMTRRRIRDLILQSIERWEPRIAVDRVEVAEVENRPTRVRVEIAYRLRRTGVAQQLGLSLDVGA